MAGMNLALLWSIEGNMGLTWGNDNVVANFLRHTLRVGNFERVGPSSLSCRKIWGSFIHLWPANKARNTHPAHPSNDVKVWFKVWETCEMWNETSAKSKLGIWSKYIIKPIQLASGLRGLWRCQLAGLFGDLKGLPSSQSFADFSTLEILSFRILAFIAVSSTSWMPYLSSSSTRERMARADWSQAVKTCTKHAKTNNTSTWKGVISY